MKKLLFVIFLSFASNIGYSQDYGNKASALELCANMGSSNFGTDIRAENALELILNTIGASKRFILLPCENVNNASAFSLKGIRYIFYNKDFMQSIDSGNNWGNLFVLAHEVGHHINNHTLDFVLYATKTIGTITLKQKRQQEIEADEFAGFVLAKLGGSLSEANKVIQSISSNKDDTYSTHPSRNKRLKAVKIGFQKANNQSSQKKYNTKEGIALEYFYKGLDKVNKKDKIGAIADFNKSLESDNNNAEVYYNRGMLYAYEDDYAAISDFSNAIKLNPNEIYGTYYWNRGVSKHQLNDFNGAINDYDKSISLKITNDKYVNRAFVYRCRAGAKASLDDRYGAISDITKAIDLDPNNGGLYYDLAYNKYYLNDFVGACQNARKAEKLGFDASSIIKNACN
jgi:tetratricopeptide (TPR) repeat protein